MQITRKFRHNDIVVEKYTRGFSFFGRVWKRYDDNHVVVIDCGKHVIIYHEDDLEWLPSYKGCYKWQHHPGNEYGNPIRFNFMPSLRRLKAMVKFYNPQLEPYHYNNLTKPVTKRISYANAT